MSRVEEGVAGSGGSVGLIEGIECSIGHAWVLSCALPIGYGLAVDDTSFSYLVQLPHRVDLEPSTHPAVQNCTGRRILSLCTWRRGAAK